MFSKLKLIMIEVFFSILIFWGLLHLVGDLGFLGVFILILYWVIVFIYAISRAGYSVITSKENTNTKKIHLWGSKFLIAFGIFLALYSLAVMYDGGRINIVSYLLFNGFLSLPLFIMGTVKLIRLRNK